MESILASHPVAQGLIPGVPEDFSVKFFREKIDDVASLIANANA